MNFISLLVNQITTAFFNSSVTNAGQLKQTFPQSVSGKPVLPSGRYVQIYRDVIPGNTKDEKIANLKAQLDKLVAVGVKGILWHGFSKEMTPDVFRRLAGYCSERGLLALAAFGMGDTDPQGMGERIGAVAALPECFAVVLDMEGAWENEKEDKAKAVVLGRALRDSVPNALVIDQPWPVPTVHWSMFPWEETAAFVDIRAPQFYVNDWISSKGAARYSFCWPWFLSSWKKLNDRLSPRGLVKPMIFTIQGYKWVLKDLVNCLTTNPTIFIWCEPFPDSVTMAALAAAHKLEQLGFTGPEAVKKFQESKGLQADNDCGSGTMAALGIPMPS